MILKGDVLRQVVSRLEPQWGDLSIEDFTAEERKAINDISHNTSQGIMEWANAWEAAIKKKKAERLDSYQA